MDSANLGCRAAAVSLGVEAGSWDEGQRGRRSIRSLLQSFYAQYCLGQAGLPHSVPFAIG